MSSAQHAAAPTIARPVAAVPERVAADGLVVSAALPCLDEGERGATLVRPALERRRDVVAAGSVDRRYVHAPDRVARPEADQVLRVDAFRRAVVEGMLLNRAVGQRPADDLRRHVPGMMAEDERATSIERHRPGTRQAARVGRVNVRRGAPAGDHDISPDAGGGPARAAIVPEDVGVVRQVFDGVGRDRGTLGEVCRRRTPAGEVTRPGQTVWERRVVWGILQTPA